jgi:CheY-like chemotaxis protein
MPRLVFIRETQLFQELDRSFIRRPGYSVVWARDGETLLHEARAGADLVIGLVEMPILPGLTLCERLRADLAGASVPVVLIGDAAMRDRAKLAGASELLAAPWTRSQILAAIRGFMQVPERAADRATASLRVACRTNGETYIAFTRDVSFTGVFLKGVSLAGPGARIQMRLHVPSGGKSIEYDLEGEVVRMTGREAPDTDARAREDSTHRDRREADVKGSVPGVGVRFLDLPVDLRLPLARFVRESSGR